MKKRYVIAGIGGLAFLLFYLFYFQVAAAQHKKELTDCIRKFEKIRIEAEKVKPIALYPFAEGYQRMGYRDHSKKVVISPQFSEARPFFQDRAVVADRSWYKGFINSKGEMVIPHRFVWVTDFFDGVAVFDGTREDRNQKGFVDHDGNVVLTFRDATPFEEFTGFKNGRAKVYVHEAGMPWGFLVPPGNPVPKILGYVDCTGKVVLDGQE